MFEALIDNWKVKSKINKSLRSKPGYTNTLYFLQDMLKSPTHPLSRLSAEQKGILINTVMTDVAEKLSQSDPIVAVRNALILHVSNVAEFSVLLTTPDMAACDGISGDLKDRIPEIAKINESLKGFFYALPDSPDTPEEMFDLIYIHYHHRDLWMKTYNFHRMLLDDYHTDGRKDWLLPFLYSQSIYAEGIFRHDLALPSIIKGDEHDGNFPSGFVRWGFYGTWPDILNEGHQHPRMVWEQRWQSAFSEPSPFFDVDLG